MAHVKRRGWWYWLHVAAGRVLFLAAFQAMAALSFSVLIALYAVPVLLLVWLVLG